MYPCFQSHVRIQMGDRGSGPPPLKNHKNIGFLAIQVLLLRKVTKLPSQHSMLGHHRPASETLFKLRFVWGQMMARLWWYLDPPSSHQLKKSSKLDPLWQNILDLRTVCTRVVRAALMMYNIWKKQ